MRYGLHLGIFTAMSFFKVYTHNICLPPNIQLKIDKYKIISYCVCWARVFQTQTFLSSLSGRLSVSISLLPLESYSTLKIYNSVYPPDLIGNHLAEFKECCIFNIIYRRKNMSLCSYFNGEFEYRTGQMLLRTFDISVDYCCKLRC